MSCGAQSSDCFCCDLLVSADSPDCAFENSSWDFRVRTLSVSALGVAPQQGRLHGHATCAPGAGPCIQEGPVLVLIDLLSSPSCIS